jgi:Family of unknown function (DUF5681)
MSKGDYIVGKSKPPKATQFKKGVCPNPYGRAGKKSKTMKSAVEKLWKEKVTVREGDKTYRLSKSEALIATTYRAAMQGDGRARSEMLKLTERFGLDEDAVANETADQDALIVANYEERLRQKLREEDKK